VDEKCPVTSFSLQSFSLGFLAALSSLLDVFHYLAKPAVATSQKMALFTCGIIFSTKVLWIKFGVEVKVKKKRVKVSL
jgi:hypothetical protein